MFSNEGALEKCRTAYAIGWGNDLDLSDYSLKDEDTTTYQEENFDTLGSSLRRGVAEV